MGDSDKDIFGHWAPIYRERGYWARAVWHLTKACHTTRWQRPDPEIPLHELQSWLANYRSFGIALLMGSPFPDGTTLGAIDVDHDNYVPIVRNLLNDPIVGRIGKKGAAYFVRVAGGLTNKKLSVKGDDASYGQVVECLFQKSICVIPPTIHPETLSPYRWIGPALHEVSFEQLPIIGSGK